MMQLLVPAWLVLAVVYSVLLVAVGFLLWLLAESWLWFLERVLRIVGVHREFCEWLWYRGQFKQWRKATKQ